MNRSKFLGMNGEICAAFRAANDLDAAVLDLSESQQHQKSAIRCA
jgi:hypothetical protein